MERNKTNKNILVPFGYYDMAKKLLVAFTFFVVRSIGEIICLKRLI
jgi:hypothetical protein